MQSDQHPDRIAKDIIVNSVVTTEKGKDQFSLLVATPSHRATYCNAYLHGVVGLQKHCLTNGIGFDIVTTVDVSLIDAARNLLASLFLWRSTATHMLFIDDDMGFNVEELVKMFEWRDKDVVAVICPKKQLSWQRVKQIVLSNPDIEPAHLPSLAGSYDQMVVLPGDAPEMTVGDKPMPVAAIGTGLMLISRQCLLRLIEQANLPIAGQDPVTGRNVYEFFKTQIVNDSYLGEDFHFSNLVRRHGGEVLGCPWITVSHTGQYSFVGDLKGLAMYGQKL
jgi:hypothetical protein